MQDQLAQMMCDKDKPIKTYTLYTLCLFQEELNCLSMINNLELPIPKITCRNLEPCPWNSCITRHISCIYSLGVQVVRLWSVFHTYLQVSRRLMRFPTCLYNNTHITFNILLTFEICVILNRESGNLSSHFSRGGDNSIVNTHARFLKQKILTFSLIISYLILGIESSFKVHAPSKTC